MKVRKLLLLVSSTLMLTSLKVVASSQTPGIDPEALIERILAVEAKQRSKVTDVILDAEYVEGKKENHRDFKEEKRFAKKIYIKYLPDTVWYREEYLKYYKDGKLQKPEERDKEAAKQAEKKRKRKSYNIAYPMLNPFYPENRDKYEVSYEGVAEERINGYVCHHFKVTAKEAQSDLINGDYYFEAESFNLIKVDFSPAKLVRKTMFKLNKLNMSILYKPTPDGYWFPRQFDIEGKGKAVFFIGVTFAATEYYSHPRINTGIQAEVFEVDNDK